MNPDRLTRHEIQLIADGREMDAMLAIAERGSKVKMTRRDLARQMLELMDANTSRKENRRG